MRSRRTGGSEAEIERHWDPDCFLVGETYYAISGGVRQPLFKSTDLRNWTFVGNFLSHDLPDVAIGEDCSSGVSIVLRPETGTVRVGTADVPFSACDLREDEDIELRIFIDRYLVEVFISSRRAVVCTLTDHAAPICLDAFTVGATTQLASLEIWKLKPTNQGFLEATANGCWRPDTTDDNDKPNVAPHGNGTGRARTRSSDQENQRG